jgi:ribosomal-protein-alanine N-acetyltransferase
MVTADQLTEVSSPIIAPMRRRHLRGVVAIERQANPRPWSLRLFEGELKMPTSRLYLVALDAHEVSGYVGLMITLDEGHITNLAVHPDRRRQHIATMMLLVLMRQAMERNVADVTLEVRMGNQAAQDLYRRFGFAPGGVRKNYYAESGEDALIMWAHGIDSLDYAERLAEIEVSLPCELIVRGDDQAEALNGDDL